MAELVLGEDERDTLERWARGHTSAQALALRCRIVLACAEGCSNMEVAARLGVSRMTVGKWRARFVAHRLDGLHEETLLWTTPTASAGSPPAGPPRRDAMRHRHRQRLGRQRRHPLLRARAMVHGSGGTVSTHPDFIG